MRSPKTLLCFEDHREDGKVWAIFHKGRWRRFREVMVCVSMVTEYFGAQAKQPKAILYTHFPTKLVKVLGKRDTVAIMLDVR